jgi:DNA-binding NarL/FixJ family response regulator
MAVKSQISLNPFTEAEREIMRRVLRGQKVQDIRFDLKIGLPTYYFHWANIRRKCNKETSTQAIIYAQQNNFL